MKIILSKGEGHASTELGAFDKALYSAGIANYNLLRLSSVIPPNSEILINENGAALELPGKWGDRLYVVMAEQRVSEPGVQAWAGIGWVQDSGSGKGLFVEHEGTDEESVRSDISSSLEALTETRGIDFGPVEMVVNGITCVDKPVCAMVIAAYQTSGWDNTHHLLGESH